MSCLKMGQNKIIFNKNQVIIFQIFLLVNDKYSRSVIKPQCCMLFPPKADEDSPGLCWSHNVKFHLCPLVLIF